MRLTVIQRVIGGFGILTVLLLIISVSTISALRKIQSGMLSVTKISGPALEISAGIEAELYAAAASTIKYANTRVPERMKALLNEYEGFIQTYQKLKTQLAKLAAGAQGIQAPLAKANKLFEKYEHKNASLFEIHKTSVELDSVIESKRSDFEDLADELDAMLEELAEATGNQQVTDVKRLVQDATVLTTDGLRIQALETLETSLNELASVGKEIREKSSTISNTEITQLLNKFLEFIGPSGILARHKERLQLNNKTQQLMNDVNQILAELRQTVIVLNEKSSQLAKSTAATVEKTIDSSNWLLTILSIMAILIASGIGYWVSTSIRHPLATISEALRKVADGDMTQQIQIQSSDEFGQLSEWINALVSKLRTMLAEISASAERLAAAAEETSVISEQTRKAVDQQKDQITQIATAMAEMAATVKEVERSAINTMNTVDASTELANKGEAIVTQNGQRIAHLSEEIEKAATVINQLDEYSTNIGAILDVIRGIADQTNLLALNAAIEAARAGEHGRGFSVVADEVRTLASRTQESTADIQRMIEELLVGTQKAVDVMKRSRDEANECVALSQNAAQALREINEGTKTINEMTTHITEATKEQASVTEEMHKNIESISSISEQTADGANDTSNAAKEQAALAAQLQALVNRFKT